MANVSAIDSLLASLAGVLVAIVVALLAIRGRREAFDPRCRRCGYDVSRRPAGVERCSECGANLTANRAITTTRRRPRWLIAACGFAAFAVFALLATRDVRRVDWHAQYLQFAPTSWLIANARRDHSTKGDDYRFAWRDRGDRRGEYYDHLLDLQRDVAGRPDLSPMFDGIDNAFLDGTLTPAQQRRYAEGLQANVRMHVARRARIGDAVPFLYEADERVGEFDRDRRLRFKTRCTLFLDGDGPLDYRDEFVSTQLHAIVGRNAGERRLWPRDVDPTPGPHRLTFRVGYQLFRGNSDDDRNRVASDATPVWPAIEVAQTFDVDVLPRGATLGTPIVDASQGDAIARAVEFELSSQPGRAWQNTVRIKHAPVDCAFAVKVRVDGVEREIGKLVARAGESADLILPDGVRPRRRPGGIAVRLRPGAILVRPARVRERAVIRRVVARPHALDDRAVRRHARDHAGAMIDALDDDDALVACRATRGDRD